MKPRQYWAAYWGWQSVAWSMGSEASTGRGLGESLLAACYAASTGWGLMEESGAPGSQGREKNFGGKPQKRKAGGFKVSAQIFQREQKAGATPLLKRVSSGAGRELGGGW